jgi:hypothetical protein
MPRVPQRLLAPLYVLLVAIPSVGLPRIGNPNDLDCSWQGLLQDDWNHGARFGVDTVFTYGPTGYLLAQSMFVPQGLWLRTVLGSALALAMVACIVVVARELPNRAWRVGFLLGVLLLSPFLHPAGMFQALAALGIACLARLAPHSGPAPPLDRRTWTFLAATMTLFAVAGFAKFTYFVLAGAEVAVIAGVLLLLRRPTAAAAVASSFVVAIAGVWLAVGQALGDLPRWLHGSSEIARGYNECMGIIGEAGEVWSALAMITALTVIAVLLWFRPRAAGTAPSTRLVRWGGTGIAFLTLFLTWKAGFSRQDSGHTMIFFGYAAMAPVLLLAAMPPARVGIVTGAAITAASIAGAWLQVGTCRTLGIGMSADDFVRQSVGVLAPGMHVEGLVEWMAAERGTPRLPRLRQRVGDHPIDITGHQQGLLFAAGFHVRHRPVFQGYSSYTPYLQQLNGDFFRGTDAPAMTIVNVQAIDARLPMNEDSQMWLALLTGYQPTCIEQDLVLMERATDPGPLALPARRVFDRDTTWDEWIDVPASGDWHTLALDIGFSPTGHLAEFLWRPGHLYLDLRTSTGQVSSWTIGPSLSKLPFLVDPLIRSNNDFVRTYLDAALPRVAAFRVRAEPGMEGHYRRTVVAHLDAMTRRPGALSAETRRQVDQVADTLAFPKFSWYPFKAEPEDGVHPLDDRDGVLAHAPCSLLFRWPGGRHQVRARFSMLPGSYSAAEKTDGASFTVEIGAATPRRVVFERLLRPANEAADRGVQQLALDLDLPEGEIVALVTGMGPANACAYDWTAWHSVSLDSN